MRWLSPLLPLMLLLLAGCAAGAPVPTPAAAPAAASAPARHLQLIADPMRILAGLPPDLADGAVAPPPAPADPAALDTWDDPLGYWVGAERRASQLDGQGAARAQAEQELFNAALGDGLALADIARAQGHAVSDDAVLAELAWRLIAQQHPLRADVARADAEAAAWAGSWRGVATAPGVVTGRLLGAAVADAVSSRGQREELRLQAAQAGVRDD